MIELKMLKNLELPLSHSPYLELVKSRVCGGGQSLLSKGTFSWGKLKKITLHKNDHNDDEDDADDYGDDVSSIL